MMLAFFNTQTLALLAVAVGFIVLCLGLWYLWTNHAQLRTEVQLLRSQHAGHSGSNYQALSTKNSVPDAGAEDIITLMRGNADASASASPEVHVCRMSEAAPTTNVVHRTVTGGADDNDSETSGSEYDDDDEDITDEEDVTDEEETNNTPSADTVETTTPDMATLTTADDETQPPVNLVESLLSSMVTNAIDGAVELQGGATVIMSSVNVNGDGDGDGDVAEASSQGATIEDVTEEMSATVECDDSTTDDIGATLDIGSTAFADELRQHTVAQLKVICQEHQVNVRRTNGSNKRKDELIKDLVAAMYWVSDDDDTQDTASNESANAAQ